MEIGNIIFVGFTSLFALVLFINPQQIKSVIFYKAFNFFLLINIINVLYWLFFHSFLYYEAEKYLLARSVQFAIISFSIYYHFEYYKNKFLDHLVYIIFGIIVISLIVNFNIIDGRYSGIIWNANQLSSFCIIGFASLLLNPRKKTNFEYFLLSIFLIIALSTGSRGVLIGIPLVFVFKFGFSVRNILYAVIAISVYLLVVTLQLDTSVNRFADQSLFNDRLLQYQYSYETLIQKPFFGYGLDKYSYIDKSLVPFYLKHVVVGAHNGYLAILVQYGIIVGFLVLVILFRQSFLFFNKYTFKNLENRFYIYIIAFTLVSSFYESLMTGINEFQTILFWFALAFLSYSKFRQANAI
jgi:O-antigen ligase